MGMTMSALGSEPYIDRRDNERPAPITIDKIRNMGRNTRDHIRAYSQSGEMKKHADAGNYSLIKQFAIKHKTHRCSGEQDYGVVRNIMKN